MAISPEPAAQAGTVRDHGFHTLRVASVVAETAEASSFVLDVPAELVPAYEYRAGQFVTFRVTVDGEQHLRSYSMSSAPAVDDVLQVTVKRVPGGIVSNWMIDTLGAGDAVEVTRPAGVFCLGDVGGDVVAFGAGSGVTPIFSIVKTALATTDRRVHLLYANRDRDSIIFGGELERLVEAHAGRLHVAHHLDVEAGFVDAAAVRAFVEHAPDAADDGAEYFICGPPPFMDIVEGTLLADGVDPERIRIERFTPPADAEPADPDAPVDAQITIELDGRTATAEHHPGTTILQMARQMGLSPPFSCESGSCATCMARVVEGAVSLRVNNALTPDEVSEGWALTCQAEPTTPTVHVVYGYD